MATDGKSNNYDNVAGFEIFDSGISRRYDRGSTVLYEEQEPPGVYLITYGFLKACTITPDGERNIVWVLGHYEIFPLTWAVSGRPVDVAYTAITPVVLEMVPLAVFKEALQTNRRFADKVTHTLSDLFSSHSERVQNLEFRRARQRIAYRLLYLARKWGSQEGDGISLDLPVTHQDLADATAMTRETANREMLRLASAGHISLAGTRVKIKKPEALALICQ